MSKGTPMRPIRLTDDLWAKAQAKAAEQDTTASEVIRQLLTNWVEMDHALETIMKELRIDERDEQQ